MQKSSDEPNNLSRLTSKRPKVKDAPRNPQSAAKARRTVRVVKSEGQTDGSDASDESSDDAPQHDLAVPKHWHRPSGKDAAAYAEWETWKPRRWAWEFLRRNDKFQTACGDEWDDPLTIAQDFRLRYFKDYRQEYAVGQKPRFGSGIRSFPKQTEFTEHNKSDATLIEVKTELFPTEVLIRFQIAPLLLKEKTGLDYQIDQARGRLRTFAKKLRQLQRDEGGSKNRWAQSFDRAWLLAALRILDWEESGNKLNRREAADELLPDALEDSHRSLSLQKRSARGTALLIRAHELARSGYLLIRSGKLKTSR